MYPRTGKLLWALHYYSFNRDPLIGSDSSHILHTQSCKRHKPQPTHDLGCLDHHQLKYFFSSFPKPGLFAPIWHWWPSDWLAHDSTLSLPPRVWMWFLHTCARSFLLRGKLTIKRWRSSLYLFVLPIRRKRASFWLMPTEQKRYRRGDHGHSLSFFSSDRICYQSHARTLKVRTPYRRRRRSWSLELEVDPTS